MKLFSVLLKIINPTKNKTELTIITYMSFEKEKSPTPSVINLKASIIVVMGLYSIKIPDIL